jgi:hypothetical protein
LSERYGYTGRAEYWLNCRKGAPLANKVLRSWMPQSSGGHACLHYRASAVTLVQARATHHAEAADKLRAERLASAAAVRNVSGRFWRCGGRFWSLVPVVEAREHERDRDAHGRVEAGARVVDEHAAQVVSRWSVGGQKVVSRWSVGGQKGVRRWSVGGQKVVRRWSEGGQKVVSRWSEGGQ